MVDPLSHFSMTGVIKSYVMCYPVCRLMHIKETLLLIGKGSPISDGSGFTLLLSMFDVI